MKVTWSREEDVQHDIYRPYYYDRIAAALDTSGKPVAWSHRIAGPSIIDRWAEKSLSGLKAAGLSNLITTIRGVDLDAGAALVDRLGEGAGLVFLVGSMWDHRDDAALARRLAVGATRLDVGMWCAT